MNKEQLKALGLNDSQIEAVLNAYKDFVPRDRLNEANEARKQAESQLAERDKQLTELKKTAGDNEELKKQIETLQSDNKAAKEKFAADLKALKIDNAVSTALTVAKAKNVKAVKALLDLNKITIEGDEVKGINEQIKELVKGADTSFLFDAQQQPPKPKGMEPAGGEPNPQPKPYAQMNYSERVAYLAAGGKPE